MKRWINVERRGVFNTTTNLWEVTNIFTVPEGYVFKMKHIRWIDDVTQQIDINNLNEYEGVLYKDDQRDETTFHMVPTFSTLPVPYRRSFNEREKIDIYFESSVAATFDYIIVSIAGYLIPVAESKEKMDVEP